jgi:hypothetical protein
VLVKSAVAGPVNPEEVTETVHPPAIVTLTVSPALAVTDVENSKLPPMPPLEH